MLCSWTWSANLIDATTSHSTTSRAPPTPPARLGVQPGRRNVVQVQDELWRALRVRPRLVERSDRITRLGRHRGVVSFQVTHSLDDLEALPTEADRAKARGMAARNAILLLGGMADRELDGLRRITPLTDNEAALITSWAAPPTWHAGHTHPGRGKYLIKSGERLGLPVALQLTPTEQQLYDTDRAFHRHPRPSTARASGRSGMTRPAPNRRAGHLLREAAAPLLLLAALGAGGLATLDVWAAAGLATGDLARPVARAPGRRCSAAGRPRSSAPAPRPAGSPPSSPPWPPSEALAVVGGRGAG